MNCEKSTMIKYAIGILVLAIGYYFKGMPMLVSLVFGWYLVAKAISKKKEEIELAEEAAAIEEILAELNQKK